MKVCASIPCQPKAEDKVKKSERKGYLVFTSAD